MAARIFIGGEHDGHSDLIHDQVRDKHPTVVLVYLWDEKNQSYHVKTYAQTHPEET